MFKILNYKKIIILGLILIIFLSLVSFNKVYSAAVTPTSYINTVHSVMLCETGSSETTCLNPVILGSEGTTGKSFDLSSTTAGESAGGIGSLSSVPYGKTFTWFQVILNRNFTVTAAGSDDTAACITGGDDASAASGATPADGTRDNTASNATAQVIRIPDNTTLANHMNGTDAIDGTVTANEEPAGDPVDGDTPYIKFRVELSVPFILKPGRMPNVQVAFDLANAVQFDDAAACLVWPNAPLVSITFVE